jgi:hypothetical protein
MVTKDPVQLPRPSSSEAKKNSQCGTSPTAHRSTQPTERTTSTARRPDRAAVAAVAAGCCATGLRHVGLVGGRRCFPGDHGDHLGHLEILRVIVKTCKNNSANFWYMEYMELYVLLCCLLYSGLVILLIIQIPFYFVPFSYSLLILFYWILFYSGLFISVCWLFGAVSHVKLQALVLADAAQARITSNDYSWREGNGNMIRFTLRETSE